MLSVIGLEQMEESEMREPELGRSRNNKKVKDPAYVTAGAPRNIAQERHAGKREERIVNINLEDREPIRCI
jgi:hypothetical protein